MDSLIVDAAIRLDASGGDTGSGEKLETATSAAGDNSCGISSYDFYTLTKWNPSEVASWLRSKGHREEYINLLCEEQRIDGKSLLLLTENDLRQPPIQIKILGDVKRLYFDILELQHTCSPSQLGFNAVASSVLGGNLPFLYFPPSSSNTSHVESDSNDQINNPNGVQSHNHLSHNSNSTLLYPNFNHHLKKIKRKKRRVSVDTGDETPMTDYDEDPQSSCGELRRRVRLNNRTTSNGHSILQNNVDNSNGASNTTSKKMLPGYATNVKPEFGKAVLAMMYIIGVTWITALVMVIVHDRVPDPTKYPPLPDLFLDNVPMIPWAFEMCEVTGTLLFFLWMTVLFFHKHRFILIRRFFALSGTVFLLRCVTMLITSLSVPGTHLKCNPRPYGDWISRLYNAYLIWKGAGLSIQGVRTCGDYMFSGHTVALTMLNFFITEYTTRRLYFVHTISWLLNMFGIFFILAAHEHYSIDVFIAFYITSRLFLYYHTLANNQNLMSRDTKTKIWFPMFSFFESDINGKIPNQYEWPITLDRLRRFGILFLKTAESKWKEIIPHPSEGFFRTKNLFSPKLKNNE